MSNDYPFSPYPDPFSPLAPTPQPTQPAPPVQEPANVREPFPSATPTFSPPPALQEKQPFSALATFADEAVQKTALVIVAGVLVVLILIGFGIWYFLWDKGEGEVPPLVNQDVNLILASAGGKITTPEGAALVIPAGALAEDTKLEISKVRDGDVTDLFELKPLGQKFLKPVTVEIPYKKSGPIVLEYWKEKGGEKQELEYVRIEEMKKLRTEVREF